MQKFTGYEYILIDIANAYGLDKDLFETRIDWAKAHLDTLESMVDLAETKPLFLKGVMALRKAQAGIPTGHMVGLDACCSGLQIMSAVTGCIAGATSTGLVDPNVRADAYSKTTELMDIELGGSGVNVSRKDAKQALMTAYYASKMEPLKIFGEDTPELDAFYQAAIKVGPGAWELLQDLLGAWQPYALSHNWQLPDGFNARVKVMSKVDKKNPRSRIEVDELDHASFTYEFYENEGCNAKGKAAKSIVANVIHSFDAYVVRCIQRRCNYDRAAMEFAAEMIEMEMIRRSLGGVEEPLVEANPIDFYQRLYNSSGMADAVVLPYIDQSNVCSLTNGHLEALATIVNGMLAYQPFGVITVHDEFKCGPNNMNHLRQQYINIFAELAESDLLDDVLGQLHGTDCKYQKLSTNLGELIRGSNYALS